MDLFLHLCIMISIYIIFALSLNLEVGYTGLFNFGHVAFFGIGAYTSALLTLQKVPFEISLALRTRPGRALGFLFKYPQPETSG